MQITRDEINELVRMSGLPAISLPSGGGMVDNHNPSYYGIHSGPVGKIDTMPYTNSSDLVLAFGPMFSDTQTLGWSVVPSPSNTITINKNTLHLPNASDPISISAKSLLHSLTSRIDRSRLPNPDVDSLGGFRQFPKNIPPVQLSEPLNQDSLYLRLNRLLRPYDILILANATPIIGGRDIVLPQNSTSFASGLWFSIGSMLPAAQGAALAQQSLNPNARTILLEGDGSLQCSIQELSTIMREKLNVTILIVNNGGYAYERHIHGMDASYNDVASWDYLKAVSMFGSPQGYPVFTRRIRNWGELEEMLDDERFNDGVGLKLVELMVGKYDVPEKFKSVFKEAGKYL